MNPPSCQPLDPDQLCSGDSYVRVELSDCDLTGRVLTELGFEESRLRAVRAPKAAWSELSLVETHIQECDFSNGNWANSRCHRSEFSRSRLTGWDATSATLRGVCFTNCKLNLALLHETRLSDCTFEQCDLTEADFQAATLKNVRFRNCDLRGARFAGATLTGVDLRGSHIAGIEIDGHALRGTRVDAAQLPDVAHVFGVIVGESGDERDGNR